MEEGRGVPEGPTIQPTVPSLLHNFSLTSVSSQDLDLYGNLGAGVEVGEDNRLERLPDCRSDFEEAPEGRESVQYQRV